MRSLRLASVLTLIMFIMSATAALAQTVDETKDALSGLNPWENWQIILAFVLPLLIQLITTRLHDRNTQALAAFAAAIVATVIGMIISGELAMGGMDVVTTPLKVFVAVIAFYKGFWNPLGTTPSTGEAAIR